jgi:hypothetical protein
MTLHSGERHRPAPAAPELSWLAGEPDGPRHAFPPGDGYPPRALCGRRWTAAYGHPGEGECEECAAVLRAIVRGSIEGLPV